MRTDKLTSRFQQALADAQSLAVGRDHNMLEPSHLLAALLDQQGGSTVPLLAQAGVPVVPIAIEGSGAVLPAAGFRVRPGTITLRIGDPIPTAELHAGDRHALAQRAHAAVAALLGASYARANVNESFTSAPPQ